MTAFEGQSQRTEGTPSVRSTCIWADEKIAGVVFLAALAQFAFFAWLTLDQPILDMWGFRPAQTAASVPHMLREGAWFANVVPIFGAPWLVPLEFPLYQWCVAAGASEHSCGRRHR